MHRTDPRELLVHTVKILKKLRIPHMVTGGIAVLVWGRPRFTADIDIVIELRERDVPRLEEALLLASTSGYLDKDAMIEAVERCGEFNFIDGDTGIKVDFWVLKENDAFDKSRMKRKRTKTILGEKIYFIAPEDLILIKLKWYDESASSKQLEDVTSIVKISGYILDWDYIKRMARRLGLFKLVSQIRLRKDGA